MAKLNCDNFGQRIEGVTVGLSGQVSFTESKPIPDGVVIMDVPPSKTGATIPNDFVNMVATSHTLEDPILNNDGCIDKISTLGYLESRIYLRVRRKSNQQFQTFAKIAEQMRVENSDFIDVPTEMSPIRFAPNYKKIRTEVNQLANSDVL